MLYYLFQFLQQHFNIPGSGLFNYISFRAGAAILVSLLISMVYGKSLVNYLRRKQVGETVRDLGLDGQIQKQGTPTMGGLIILAAIIIPTLLFARLINVYIIIMLITTVWCGIIGFVDDYIKVFRKDKRGLAGRFKIFGQVSLGIIIGSVLYFNDDVVVRRQLVNPQPAPIFRDTLNVEKIASNFVDAKLPITTIPFVKNHEFNYSKLIAWVGDDYPDCTWIV